MGVDGHAFFLQLELHGVTRMLLATAATRGTRKAPVRGTRNGTTKLPMSSVHDERCVNDGTTNLLLRAFGNNDARCGQWKSLMCSQ